VWSRNEARAATNKRALAEDVVLEPSSSVAVAVVYADEAPALPRPKVMDVIPRTVTDDEDARATVA
jgi:hypothetical protein